MPHDLLITFFVIISFVAVTFLLIISYPVVYGKSIMPTGSKFFLFNYVIFIYIGVFLMNVFHFKVLEVEGIYSTTLNECLLPMYNLNIVALPLFFIGGAISNLIFKISPTERENKMLVCDGIGRNKFYKSSFFLLFTLIVISCVLIVLKIYIDKLGGRLPILEMLFSEDANIRQARSDATNNFDGKKYRYIMILQDVPLYFFIIYSLINKKNVVHRFFLFFLFLICAFTSIMDGVKSPLIQLLLLSLMLVFFNKKNIPIRTLLLFAIGATSFMAIMYISFMGMAGRDFSDILMAPINRILLGSSRPMIYYLDYVPQYADYLMGSSFPNPGRIFPFEWRQVTVEIMNHAHPELTEIGVVGSMPATFYGEFYLNFGYSGAIFSMLFLGFMLKVIDNIFVIELTKSTLFMPFLALFFIYIHIVGTFSRTTFMGLFVNANLVFLTALAIFLFFINFLFISMRGNYARKNHINCTE